MRAVLTLISIACGAYSSYWVTMRLISPLCAQYFKPLDRARQIIITVAGTIIFVFNFFLWLFILAGIYLYGYKKNKDGR
jgi:hypothetical protein